MNKIVFALAALIATSGFTLSGGQAMAAENNNPTQTITRFGTLSAYKGPEQYFTGNVTIQPLFDPKQPDAPLSGAYVTFEPGARSNWHKHPAGQHLVVIEGVGLTGTVDGTVEEFRAGDVLWCPVGVKHWHGAAPDQSMTHLALTGTLPDGRNAEWMEPVTDEQYNAGKK